MDFLPQFSPFTLILTVLLVLLIGCWLRASTNHKNLPPGPWGVPVLGYLPFLGDKPYFKFEELAKKYGPVFSLYLGPYLSVVLTDFKSVKEALGKEEYLGRPEHTIFNLLDSETPSLLDFSGKVWKEQRRFALHVFRDLGMGRSVMEEHILDEISDLLPRLRETQGASFDLCKLLAPSMSNNITALVMGERFQMDDPRRKILDEAFVKEDKGKFTMLSAVNFLPWIMKVIVKLRLFGIEEFYEKVYKLRDLFKDVKREHEKTLDENNIRDYMDAFIIEMKKRKGQDSSFNEKTLIGNSMGFFGAGSETVQISVTWLMIIMASYPEVQSRVQKEIDDVIGDRTPQWKDNAHLPYVNAVINEMYRWSPIAPINLPRCTTADSTLSGYSIPKGTLVISNIHSIHRDPSLWENPEIFDPTRFYKKKVAENLVTFSFGKRSCPGEGLATLEVFLYFVSFMQNFTISLPEGVKPDFGFILDIAAIPNMSVFCMKERKK